MLVLFVAYDLHHPGSEYAQIEGLLKSAGSWAHPQGSVWLIDTQDDPSTWVERLRAAGDPSDEFFVTRLHHYWASYGMDADVVAWLEETARSW